MFCALRPRLGWLLRFPTRRAVLLRAVGPRVRDINVVVRVDLLLLVRRDVVLAADIELDRAALVVQRRDIEAVPKDGALGRSGKYGRGARAISETRQGKGARDSPRARGMRARAGARRVTVGAIVEQHGRRVVAVGDGAADDRDALRARRGPLEEAAVPAEHVLARIPERARGARLSWGAGR